MATGTGFQKAMHAMRAIAAVSTCAACGLPRIAVAEAWRGRGNGGAASHFNATQFTAVCTCVNCGGCGERVPRDETERRLVDRIPGEEPTPLRLCRRCSDAADAREIL